MSPRSNQKKLMVATPSILTGGPSGQSLERANDARRPTAHLLGIGIARRVLWSRRSFQQLSPRRLRLLAGGLRYSRSVTILFRRLGSTTRRYHHHVAHWADMK